MHIKANTYFKPVCDGTVRPVLRLKIDGAASQAFQSVGE